jgi:hypothetical protein
MASLSKRRANGAVGWGNAGKDARTLAKFRQLLSRTNEEDRRLLLFMAKKMVKSKTP